MQNIYIENDSDYIVHNGYIYKKYKKVNVDSELIIQECCKYYGIDEKSIMSKDRYKTNGTVPARHMAMYMMNKINMLSQKTIQNIFFKNDHSTIYHAVRKIQNQIELYEDVKLAFNTILNNIDNAKTNTRTSYPIFQREGD